MTPKEWKEQLNQGDLSGMYFFSGREDYLKDFFIRELIAAVLPNGDDGMNYLRIAYDKANALSLTDYAQAFPVFAERKILYLTVTGDDDAKRDMGDAFAALAQNFPEYLTLIVLLQQTEGSAKAYTELKKACAGAREIVLNEQEPAVLRPWLIRHAAADGKTLLPADAEYLLSLTDNGMLNLDHELKKITAYSKGESITRADIDAVVIRTMDAAIYELADAIIAADAEKTLRVADGLLEKSVDQIVLASVYNFFSRLCKVSLLKKEGVGSAEIASILGLKSGSVRKFLKISDQIPFSKIKRFVSVCTAFDAEMKRTSRDKKTNMEVFFLRLIDLVKND